MKKIQKSTPATIGVITGLDLVGDALIKLPFVRALRHAYPHAQIHWITSMGPTTFATVLRQATSDLIDQFHIQPMWVTDSSQAGTAPHFDLLIDTRSRWREAMVARRIPHGIFLSRSTRFLFSDRRPPLLQSRPLHLCDRLLQFVELATGQQPVSGGSLKVPEILQEQALRLLPKGRVYIGVAPGCSTPVRMWPRDRFIELAKIQVEKGRVPVFILGPMESDAYTALQASVPEALFPLQMPEAWGNATLTIDHTLAVGQRLNLCVGNDSGPGHMMAAVACPVISLFGPTSPLKTAPRVDKGVSVCAQDFGSTNMEAIPMQAAIDAVDKVLTAI